MRSNRRPAGSLLAVGDRGKGTPAPAQPSCPRGAWGTSPPPQHGWTERPQDKPCGPDPGGPCSAARLKEEKEDAALNYRVDPVCNSKHSISHLNITGTIYILFSHEPSKRIMFTLSARPSLDNPNFTCSTATYGEWLPHGSVWPHCPWMALGAHDPQGRMVYSRHTSPKGATRPCQGPGAPPAERSRVGFEFTLWSVILGCE